MEETMNLERLVRVQSNNAEDGDVQLGSIIGTILSPDGEKLSVNEGVPAAVLQEGNLEGNCTDEVEARRLRLESVHLLEIFPNEIWLAISEQITAPSDLESFSNASLFFRKLVLDRRAAFLFPQVLNFIDYDLILFSRINHETKALHRLNKPQKCVACGRKRYWKWYSDLISFRLVCWSWCIAVSQLCEQSCYTNCGFRYQEDIQDFLRHFAGSHASCKNEDQRSPFLCGVSLMLKEDSECVKFPTLLSLYGGHITRFYVVDMTFSAIVECDNWPHYLSYSKIPKLLRRMPRLRRLGYEVDMDGEWESSLDAEVDDLKRATALLPMPKIPSLEWLKTAWLSGLPAPVLKELFRVYSSQLRVLEVGRDADQDYTFLYKTPLPQLKEFCMNSYRRVQERELKMLRNTNWPALEKLKLSKIHSNVKWSKVLSVLSNRAWAATLHDVSLSSHYQPSRDNSISAANEMLRESAGLRIELPHLKHFRITMHYPCPLDFLLPTKNSLETLHVDVGTVEWLNGQLLRTVAAEQIILFLGYEQQMYRSNKWKLFPKLQQISGFIITEPMYYSREEWE